MKYLVFVAITFISSTFNNADAQEYKVETIDGGFQIIHVLFNDEAETLNISCSNDTIHIRNVFVVEDSTALLNGKFLKIVYRTRGGTGIHVIHTLLLCIHIKTLCQSVHLTSTFDEEFIDFRKKHDSSDLIDEKSVYELKFNLEGGNIQTYKLNISLHDERKSKDDTSANHNINNQFVLNFDKNQGIFYGKIENISDYFTLYVPKTRIKHKQFIMSGLPTIKLGDFKYYFISGDWYEVRDDNHLTKYCYR